MPWFRLKLRLSFSQWSKLVDAGTIDKARAYLREVQMKLTDEMEKL